jgi:SAM-dependent methyltransferase
MMDGWPRRKHGAVLREHLSLRGARVLDVGCGDGSLVRLMTREGARVTGIECSPAQLAPAYAREPVGDEDYLVAHGEALPIAEASLDIVVYFNVLHHVPVESQLQALREARRVLRSEGTLYVQEPVAEGPYFELVRPVDDETFVRARAYGALGAVLEEEGLEQIAEYRYVTPLLYDDFEAFKRQLLAVDAGRAERLAAHEASLREAFAAAGEKHEGAYRFEAPARLNLLRRDGAGRAT